MSNIASATKTATATATTLPVVASRSQVVQFIKDVRANHVHHLAGFSTDAKRQSFVMTCYAIALQRAVIGQDELARNIRAKAETLTDFNKTKKGTISGTLGKVLTAFEDALILGKSLAINFDLSADTVDLSCLNNAPEMGEFSKLFAPKPKAAKVEQLTDKAADTDKAAQIAAQQENAAPLIATTFKALNERDNEQATRVLRELAESLGFNLVAKKKTVSKKAA